MDKLVCSISGYVGNQKRFKYKDINKHFENAKEIGCLTNKCTSENKEKRIIDTAKSIQKAKQLREIGIQTLKEQGNLSCRRLEYFCYRYENS